MTAIGYHAAGDGALALDPVGRQANEGLLSRVARRLFGGGSEGLRYYQLGGAEGPSTAALDVGAAPGTDVYSPVDGTIVGITTSMLRGKVFGARIDVQPANEPALVVSAHAPQAGPGAHRWLLGRSGDLQDRHGHRLLDGRAAGARALHAGRGQPRLDRAPPSGHPGHPLKLLFVADVNGRPGRRAVEERLPALREELDVDFCVANGENAADGVGITPKLADKLLAAGVDVLTLGNHTGGDARSSPTSPAPSG